MSNIDFSQMITAEAKAASAEAARKAAIDAAIQGRLNEVAQGRGYTSADSLVSWALSNQVRFQEEAARFALWRDEVWVMAVQMQEANAEITAAEILGALPAIDWERPLI
ncbi:hypothetical protein [Salipiger sp. PrR007]|uniref:hypothetical protein n=1 Tax=Salipiger sp. PrR007 TaxID=2706884 RepID=UPI0013B835F4|nr:hypothetical protein [Salipiger sp. PrR007]NDW31888.1 hypothetical protein [Salipiger sp. PrR007]